MALIAAGVLTLPALARGAAPVFAPPTAIDATAATDAAGDGSPRIATDGRGTWLAVWAATSALGGALGTDSDILVARSTDLGASWSAPAPVNASATSDEAFDFAPALATDGRGTWVVTWTATNGADTDVFVARSFDAGATWSAPAPLYADAATDAGNDDHPQIATDGTTWIVAWDSTGRLGTDRDVLLARSLDGGATWSAPAPLVATASGDRGADQRPQLATDGAGTWMVVWTGNDGTRGGDYDVWRARSTDAGVTWSAPAALNANPATDAALDDRPQIAADGQGTWVAAWVSDADLGGTIGADLDVLTARSTDGGLTWSAPAPLNTNAATDDGADGAPALVTDRHGTWVAVWESTPPGGDPAILMAHSLDGGAHWSAPRGLDAAAATDGRRDLAPQIATDGRGMWNAVWTGIGGTFGADGDVLRAGGREHCGNGVVDPGEQCDDGNTVGGDACPASCEFPPSPGPFATWTPPGAGGTAGAGTPTPDATSGETPAGSSEPGATPSDGGTSGPTASATPTTLDPNATPVAPPSLDPDATATATVDPAATTTATHAGTDGGATATPGTGTATPSPTPTAIPGASATTIAGAATPTPPPPRFGGRLADLGAAKAAVTCQRALVKAGTQAIGKRLGGFGSCARSVQRCIQTQPDDPACLAKAAARCASALRGLDALDVKTAASLQKKCSGRLAVADVLGASGLGLASVATGCGDDGDGDLGDLVACVVGEHACRAATMFEIVEPRAKELMRLPGMHDATLDTVVCLPDHGGGGDTFGDPTGVGKAVDVCASAIVKAGTAFVRKRMTRLGLCVDALFTCVQLKPNDAGCLAKARARCDGGASAASGPQATAVEERALASAVAARCNESVIAYASLRAARAANLDALAGACAAVGVPALDTLADYQQCLLRAEACRVEGVLRVQAPRIAELLGVVGRSFGSPYCY